MSANNYQYKGNPSINRERDQRTTFFLEEGQMLDTATTTYDFSSHFREGEQQLPPAVEIFTHDGGMENTVDATWTLSDGDTIQFRFWDPDNDAQRVGSAADMPSDGSSTPPVLYTDLTHVLAGVTATAATAQQVVDSLNADVEFAKWAYAALGPTANRVAIYLKGPRARMSITGGTAQAVILFPATEIDNAERTFTHVGPGQQGAALVDRWDVAYDNGTGILTVTNNTDATANGVSIRVDLFS